jgi:ribosomal protein S18 acetylase RimI-like enzyme
MPFYDDRRRRRWAKARVGVTLAITNPSPVSNTIPPARKEEQGMNVAEITPVHVVDNDVVAAVQRLFRQVSSSATVPTADDLAAIVAGPGTLLLVARDPIDPKRIVGMLTLVTFRIPSGLRAWIEDVAVDQVVRGLRIGEALSRAAVQRARALGARTVELTSRPSREAANRLYRKIGFEIRSTNVYRLGLNSNSGWRGTRKA